MSDSVIRSPKFDAPPVIETVLGVEFRPLRKWNIPHFGLFWQRIRDEFPKYAVQPPLMSQIEKFGQPQIQQEMGIELLESPEVRCWFVHPDEARLIQVQRDRFIHNWRKRGDHTYPSYDSIKPQFEASWDVFCGFLKEEKISAPEVVQCEVTYINHIEVGQGWNSTSDLKEIFPFLSGQFTEGFLPQPEGVELRTTYLFSNGRGRLYIALQPAIRRADLKQVLQLTLTARGAPISHEKPAILEWFDLGHDWVVRGFADFTSERMHDLWKRRS